MHLSSHNLPIESNDEFLRLGTTYAACAEREIFLCIGILHVFEGCSDVLSGWYILGPLVIVLKVCAQIVSLFRK